LNKEIDGIVWTYPPEMSENELLAYVGYVKESHADWLSTLYQVALTPVGEEMDIRYMFRKVPFERIRRITGYLVGTVDRWNDAKRKELEDRVKHNVQD
jgi:hypothetical protein